MKMLLLVQNEIGQIVGQAFTKSENNAETEALLSSVMAADKLGAERNPRFAVTDNANAVRSMVQRVCPGFNVKQDSFHVIQRVSEKVKSSNLKKKVSKQMKQCLYSVDHQLRDSADMEMLLTQLCEKVRLSDLACSEAEWRGCIQSNISQIRRGNMDIAENECCEREKAVCIVSTSQLKDFHSALKKLTARYVSVEVSLRILDVFIVQHNLKIGADFGRNKPFGAVDFLALSQAAIMCQGVGIAYIPQLEYALDVFSEQLCEPTYRNATPNDFDIGQWMRMFTSAKADVDLLEGRLTRPREHRQTVLELLLNSSSVVESRSVHPINFIKLLNLDERGAERESRFSAQEHELLRQVQREQQ